MAALTPKQIESLIQSGGYKAGDTINIPSAEFFAAMELVGGDYAVTLSHVMENEDGTHVFEILSM